MAYNSLLKNVSIAIEVESGYDTKGNQIFRKRSYSGIKGTATAEQIGIVADVIKSAIAVESKDVFKNSTEQIQRA